MKKLIPILLFLLICFLSCRDQEKVKAKIFERKQVEKNRLLIHFQYQVGSSIYKDSAIIRNTIIRNDSIDLIIDPANPGESIPDLSSGK